MTRYQDALLVVAGVRIAFNKLVQKLFGAPEQIIWQESSLLCLGLDGAGKSSLIRLVFDGTKAADATVEPTAGFNVRTVMLPPDQKAEIWELGGGPNIRPYWGKYATQPLDGLIFVVDAADEARLADATSALSEMLRSAVQLRVLPLLILANKQDLPNALSAKAIADKLGVAKLKERHLAHGPVKVEAVSAANGQNVEAALRWLATPSSTTEASGEAI